MPARIVDEIKQSRPFRSKAQETAVAILRTANVIRRRFEGAVEKEGVSLAQYNVLRILRGARGPLPTMEIAARMVEDAPGITRLVNNLEQKELIRREQWTGDRRQVLCEITPAGLRVLERLDEEVDRLDDATTGPLSEYHVEQLLYYLSVVREAARE
jgi:MarR family transcriptional regulator, organic hydroperoxide resistance regulator